MASLENDRAASGVPVDEVGKEAQALGLTFFRMELNGENIIPGHGAGKADTVVSFASTVLGVFDNSVIAMHEIEITVVRNTCPNGVRLAIPNASMS